jgi:copper chaperone CopZ
MSFAQTLLLAIAMFAACSRDDDKRAAQPAPAATTATKPAAKQLVEPPRPAELQRVTIKALGMYCEDSCPVKVRTALADVPAVYELGFDVSNEAIFVSYDKSLGTAKDVTRPMIAAIKGAGFDPWLSKEEWPADAKAQVVLR